MENQQLSIFESIRTVSYSTTHFEASVDAMQLYLNYRLVESGEIQESQALFWDAKSVIGARYSVLQPESGECFYIRFIESPPTPGYEPLKTYGWNATEFLVQDVHKLAKELENSAYRIIGGPRDLIGNGTVIALQVRGPSDEIFYFTELNGRSFQKLYGVANCKVDRAFMAILGVKEHAKSIGYYGAAARSTTKIRTFGIRVLANAHGLDPLTEKFDISAAICRDLYRIELDGYPETAIARPRLPDHLPPGMCMVSLTTSSIAGLPLTKTTPLHIAPEQLPYSNCQVSMARGMSDELIELLEDKKTR